MAPLSITSFACLLSSSACYSQTQTSRSTHVNDRQEHFFKNRLAKKPRSTELTHSKWMAEVNRQAEIFMSVKY